MSGLLCHGVVFYLLLVCCHSVQYDTNKHVLGFIYEEHVIVKRDINSSVAEQTTETTLTHNNTFLTPTELSLQSSQTTGTTKVPQNTTARSNTSSELTVTLSTAPSNTSTTQTVTPFTGPSHTSAEQTVTPFNITEETDSHIYYTSKLLSDPNRYYWNELVGHTRHSLSDDKHMLLSYIKLSFMFPFYGHPLDLLAITTQGFLYMSDFNHPRLNHSYTNYIAPLMANFDTFGNDSDILYKDDGNSFVVEWRKVQLNDQREKGNYTFQTTLFKNGTILFAYKSIPDKNISGAKWPVKVGISDAFFYDFNTYFGTIRYIYRYHNITFNATKLTDYTVIILNPLPTCNLAMTCDKCISHNTTFNCAWCPKISRCSDGIDRHRQEWIDASCSANAITSNGLCSIISSTSGPSPNSSPSTTKKPNNPDFVFTSDNSKDSAKTDSSKEREGSKTAAMIAVPMVVAVLLIIVFVVGWILYARSHPNTKSGRWLIEHRPSRLKEKFSNVSFARDAESGDKLRIEEVSSE